MRFHPSSALLLATLALGGLLFAQEVVPPVPSLPRPEFQDVELGKTYVEATRLLEKHDYAEARKQLRGIRGKVQKGEERDAVEQALLEADGGLLYDKVDARRDKGDLRGALKRADSKIEKYAGTASGERLAELRQEIFEEIYLVVADFEDQAAKEDEEEDGKKDDDKPARRGGGQGGGGGDTGYGQNARIVKGSPETGEVRQGKAALRWRTGARLSTLSFSEVKGKVTDYRYLNLSIRAENPKKRPQLLILFDCQDGPLRGGGGRRAGSRAFRRDGFQMSIVPEGKWQDLRLDLSRFVGKGEVTWDDVVSLRLVHLPGVEAVLVVDDLRLEKE